MPINEPAELYIGGEPDITMEDIEKEFQTEPDTDEQTDDEQAVEDTAQDEETEDDQAQDEGEDDEEAEEDEDESEEEEDEPDQPEETEDDPEVDNITSQVDAVAAMLTKKSIVYNDLISEYRQNGGKLTEATAAKLEKAGYPKDVVAAYISGQQAVYDRYADKVKNLVGGEKQYGKLAAWAEKNLSRREKEEYNAAVESGNFARAKFAIEGMKARYTNSEGKPAKLVKGRTISAKKATAKPFVDQDELIKALDDPRYETDRDFTIKVNRRLMQTDFY